MITALIYLLWILYAIYEGKREALYFSFKMKAAVNLKQGLKTDEHITFSIQRSLVVGFALIACFHDWLNLSIMFFALAACFPFFHDGMYYVTRQKLDRLYKKGWFDQSTTSVAKSDKLKLFYPVQRTVLAVVSLGIVIYEIIKFWK